MSIRAHNVELPTREELGELIQRKHAPTQRLGWGPARRRRMGYFTPSDVYEATVRKLIKPGCSWVDIGGGDAIFPDNPDLAKELVGVCQRLVAVDPSDNVQQNPFAHERVQALLEAYPADGEFDLATMRMVVEHVEDTSDFSRALGRVLRPGGVAVVFTVSAVAPLSIVSRFSPFGLHHPVKRLFWGGEEKDTFPVRYRMNSRRALATLLGEAGLDELAFARLDDLSTFSQINALNWLELQIWNVWRRTGLAYPEHCLLGVYGKPRSDSDAS
ncbi:MAG: class I SAM-dependent methyltransferase [Phycisphaeraceae bacterium]|nr:class I SAM-dependent methyltransferase [Phycisphaeraceae bacterium]